MLLFLDLSLSWLVLFKKKKLLSVELEIKLAENYIYLKESILNYIKNSIALGIHRACECMKDQSYNEIKESLTITSSI